VGGENVDELSHGDVVERVKSAGGGPVSLLVVDPDADRYFREHSVTVTASMDCVRTITCPDARPAASIGQ